MCHQGLPQKPPRPGAQRQASQSDLTARARAARPGPRIRSAWQPSFRFRFIYRGLLLIIRCGFQLRHLGVQRFGNTSEAQPSASGTSASFDQGLPQGRGPPTPSRFFLDVFAGVNAPLSQAAAKTGLDRYEPLDIISNAARDILLDSLLRLCWSGAIGLIVCAPPCKEYSRLKMRPGGLQPSGHPTTWMGFQASALLSYKKFETAGKSIVEAEPSYMP